MKPKVYRSRIAVKSDKIVLTCIGTTGIKEVDKAKSLVWAQLYDAEPWIATAQFTVRTIKYNPEVNAHWREFTWYK